MLKLQNRAGLRQFLDSFAGSEHFNASSISSSVHQETYLGPNDSKSDRMKADSKPNHPTLGYDSISCNPTAETRLVDLLDSTLWNRRLAPSSERIVYALVHQIFHGIKEHFLVSTELKVCNYVYNFVCFCCILFCFIFTWFIIWSVKVKGKLYILLWRAIQVLVHHSFILTYSFMKVLCWTSI